MTDSRRTRRRRGLTPVLITLVLSLGTPPGARADEVVYDYARVVWVEPLTEPATAPLAPDACPPPRPAGLGRLTGEGGAAGLAAAMRSEAARMPAPPSCEDAAEPAARHRIVGYRVGYRYGGEVYERTVDDHPGDRLRVRVSLRPVSRK